MARGLITRAGGVLTARLLFGDAVEGITHCALGDGDESFSVPLHPPEPGLDQTALVNERARKRFYKKAFLTEDPDGGLLVNGVKYRETGSPTQIIAFFFRFEEAEANGITIKEYGFFGGGVTYIDDHLGDYAPGGIHDPATNPGGTVLNPGTLYEIKNIPDFNKTPDTRIELVGVIKI